jgi:hypothetical protein
MPAFQSKINRMVHNGMNWSRSVDTIPDGQHAFARNIRSYKAGEITSRPGLTSKIPITAPVPPGYVHSMSRLNNSDPDINFQFEYVVGADALLYAGKDAAHFNNATINPVRLPYTLAPGDVIHTKPLSGNPLSIVDMNPVGSPAAWKYVADSSQMLAVGYYPGDNPDDNAPKLPAMARALTMGLPLPVNIFVPTAGGAGNLNGDYQWCFAFRRTITGARSNPSPATRVKVATPALTLSNQSANFTLPVTPIDPITGSPDTHTVVDVYRFGGVVFRWAWVGSGVSGASFNDNMPDESVLSAAAPPTVTDPVSGISRFSQFQPFVLPDMARYGTGKLHRQIGTGGTNIWTMFWVSGDAFDDKWLPGSAIGVNNGPVTTIYQVRQGGAATNASIEFTDDIGSFVGRDGDIVPWSTPAGTLHSGQPLNHLWGPFGLGQAGAYLFGCGSKSAPGTLFWTNGNDPDTADLANSLVVTPPSEPLVNGCIYQGLCLVWSTDRMFAVYPSLTVAGQFSVQEVPGGRGIWMEYSLTVQSDGYADVSVSWVGKDGIYSYSLANGLQSLTGGVLDLYFPHDNQPAQSLDQIFTFLDETSVLPPDFTQPNYHRLSWFAGYMFYDYVSSALGLIVVFGEPPPKRNIYNTLVWDSHASGGTGGWVSLDHYGEPVMDGLPVARYPELGNVNNLMVSNGGTIFDYFGSTDGANNFACRLVTRQDDLGDSRVQKYYGDTMVDLDVGMNDVTVTPTIDLGASRLGSTVYSFGSVGSGRKQNLLDFSTSGIIYRSTTIGLDISWVASSIFPTVLYEYAPSYVPKPELTAYRPTDWTDEGQPGDKWVAGCLIEANTFGIARQVAIWGDHGLIATITVQHDGQSTKPYAFATPAITHQLRAVPADAHAWELFRVIYQFVPKPEMTRFQQDWTDDGKPQPKYLQGFVLEGDTGGNNVSVALWADGAVLQTFVVNHAGQLEKPYAVTTPQTVHEMRLVPSGNDIRYLSAFKLSWVYTTKPELSQFTQDWTDDGQPKAKYLQGFVLEGDTGGNNVTLALWADQQLVQTFTANHNGQLEKPYSVTTPPIVHSMRLIPSGNNIRYMFDFKLRWVYTLKPELAQFTQDWTDDGKPQPKRLQGFVLQGDTQGNNVSVALWGDQALIQVFVVNHDGELEKPYAVTLPPVVHEMRLIPSGNDIRYMEEFKLAWAYTIQPEFTSWNQDYTPSDPTAYHGVAIEADTEGRTVEVDVVSEGVVVRTLNVAHVGRVQKAYSFLAPFISTEVRLVPHGDWRQSPDWVVRWIGYPKPDLATLCSNWDDCGYQGAKFFQGFVLHADTGGIDTVLSIERDGGVPVTAFTRVNHNGEQQVAYSLAVPFIAHQVRAYPDVPIRFTNPFKIRWVWEPAPELAKNWITQTTSHGARGWFHHRDAWLAIQSYDNVTLKIKDDSGTVKTYLLPTTNGAVMKLYEVLFSQKSKLAEYALTSCVPFRVFKADCEIRVREWGSGDAYAVVRPFGGKHFADGAAV